MATYPPFSWIKIRVSIFLIHIRLVILRYFWNLGTTPVIAKSKNKKSLLESLRISYRLVRENATSGRLKRSLPSAIAELVFSRPVANAPAPSKANCLFVTSI
jgi:hypothetical protein